MPETHAFLVHLRDFPIQGLLEQAHQALHFLLRATPVLRGERVDGQDFDAEVGTGLHDAVNVLRAGAVAEQAGQAALLRPAPVAVHDDSDVNR